MDFYKFWLDFIPRTEKNDDDDDDDDDELKEHFSIFHFSFFLKNTKNNVF